MKTTNPDWVLELLVEIDVPVFYALEGRYVAFISNLDIDNDGTGPSHGDPSYQPQTSYTPYLNADVDKYIVVPPQIRSMVAPVVMGCQARMTRLDKGTWSSAVVGDIGPRTKTGEAAYCLAKTLNNAITHNSGDSRRLYLYELFPGQAAVVDGKKYRLQPA